MEDQAGRNSEVTQDGKVLTSRTINIRKGFLHVDARILSN